MSKIALSLIKENRWETNFVKSVVVFFWIKEVIRNLREVLGMLEKKKGKRTCPRSKKK